MACCSHTDHFIRLFRVGSGFRDSLARTLVRLLEIEVIFFSDRNYTWSDSCEFYFHIILGSQKIVIPSQTRSYAICPAILIQNLFLRGFRV